MYGCVANQYYHKWNDIKGVSHELMQASQINMAERQQQGKKMDFKTVQLFKDQTLGIGSYGKVCKAKCDDLLCAAKLIHETLFDPTAQQLIAPQREHRLPMRRFEQECEFLSTIRHPNIVQYLGIYRDPDTGFPALLMELMDDSLTHFLENSPQPILHHIQVNICHDITLALSFLHSNDIVHRDLSSNNVLLIGNVRAKVTDFGMARLGDQNTRATQLTFTMCPGTDVYMPPEAVQDKPVYTEKIDCFSFGVITLQIITREFPKPGDRRKKIQLYQPGLPPIVEVPVTEIERRQNHIGEIDPNHTLLQVALDCLKDRDVERPSAQQLCERVAALKEEPLYSETARVIKAEQGRLSDERDRELRSLRQQVQGLQQTTQSQMSRLDEKDQALRQKDETIAAGQQQLREQINENCQLKREKNQAIEEKGRLEREKNQERERLERQLGRVNQQLEESEQVNAQFQRRIVELEQLRSASNTTSRSKQQNRSGGSIKLTWRKGKRAPHKMTYHHCAAVDGSRSTLYVRVLHQVYAYAINTCFWSLLPDSPTRSCPSVIINNLLTFVGGTHSGTITNKLFSLTGEGSGRRWTEQFPPMPTKRQGSTALCTGTALIVAGGQDKDGSRLQLLQAVEVLNTETLQWFTAADLPKQICEAPVAVYDDHVYILGESNMYACSLTTLIQSCKSFLPSRLRNRDPGVWTTAAAPPVIWAACVSILGRLLAIGGHDSYKKPTTAIHKYNPTTDSWEVISHMATPRCYCIAAVLPNNQLMVVGGYTIGGETDSVELAIIE